MIELEEAKNIVLESRNQLGEENICIEESLGRYLAGDVFSDIDIPSFHKSAMDGYACRIGDVGKELQIIETIPAGVVPQKKIARGECSKIMTGAKMPEGADYVIMLEDAETLMDGKIKSVKQVGKANVCLLGEDVGRGDKVLDRGILIKPQHMAVMASVGYVTARVAKRPRIAIVSTGSELVEPHCKPAIAKIRNSNAYQLIGQVKAAGAIPVYMGIAEDNEEATYKLLEKALAACDVVILTGGVSVGDYDFVPSIMRKCGVNIQFESIAVQPGKPTLFGEHSNALVFGLPGNPVSSFVQFELLVRPLIVKLMGGSCLDPLVMTLPMGKKFERGKAKRLAWIPVRVSNENKVMPIEYHGSAHICSLPKAHGLISLPKGVKELKEGDFVDVRQI